MNSLLSKLEIHPEYLLPLYSEPGPSSLGLQVIAIFGKKLPIATVAIIATTIAV